MKVTAPSAVRKAPAMAYPVSYEIERPERYNRLTVLFRWILAIPQLFLVGGIGLAGSSASGVNDNDSGLEVLLSILTAGVLTTVLAFLVFLAWWAILFTGRFPASFRGFCLMVFRWAMNVHAYVYLQAEPYPPFSGDKPYPLQVHVTADQEHNRLTVLFRIFLAIPHLVVLFFLNIAQGIVTLIAWIAILVTGQYPAGMYSFSVGASRWQARVLGYLYLFVDEYPPFSLASDPGTAAAQPRLA